MKKTYSLEKIQELSGGDQDFIGVLVQTFLEEIPEDMEGMIMAVKEGNAEKAYQCAHKMKPNLQLFDIDVIQSIKEMEAWSKNDKSKEAIEPVLQHITITVNLALTELQHDFA